MGIFVNNDFFSKSIFIKSNNDQIPPTCRIFLKIISYIKFFLNNFVSTLLSLESRRILVGRVS